MHAYTDKVTPRLEAIKKVGLYKGSTEFHYAMEKFGINFVHADAEATKLMNKANGNLCGIFEKACMSAPEFSKVQSPEMADEKRHILLTSLDEAFGKAGIKIVLSNDAPHIYFLKDKSSLALLKHFRTRVAVAEEEKMTTTPCPGPLTLAYLIRGTWSWKVTKAYKERVSQHVKTCSSCSDDILEMQGLKSPERPVLAEEFPPIKLAARREPQVNVLSVEEFQTAKDLASFLSDVHSRDKDGSTPKSST
jgi:hypothetical protein